MAAETAEIEKLITKHRDTIHQLEPSLQMTRDAAIALEEQNLTPEVQKKNINLNLFLCF